MGGRHSHSRPSPLFSFLSPEYKSWRFSYSLPLSGANASRNRQTDSVGRSAHCGKQRSERGRKRGISPRSDITDVSGSEKGRPHPSSNQPENNQSIRGTNPFQNGRVKNGPPPAAGGGLDGENRPRGRIPPRSSSPTGSKIFPIPVGEENNAVAVHAVRLSRCAAHIHAADASDRKRGTQSGLTIGGVHGRHIADVQHPRAMHHRSRPTAETTKAIRSHNKHQKMHPITSTTDGIFGSDRGFNHDDPIIIGGKDDPNSGTSNKDESSSSDRQADSSSPASKANRSPTISNRLRPTHSTTLQLPKGGTTNSRGTLNSDAHAVSNERPPVVDRQSSEMEWKDTDRSTTGISIRDGRIGERMGCSVLPEPRPPNRLPRVLHRRTNQQHEGIDSSVDGSKINNEGNRMEGLCSSSADRQSSNDELHQSNGGKGTPSRPHSRAHSPILFGEKNKTDGGVFTGGGQRASGSAFPSGINRHLRFEAQPNVVSINRSTLGSTHNRWPSIIDQHTNESIHQLSSRPTLPLLGHLQSSDRMQGELVDVSTGGGASDPEIIEENKERKNSISNDDSPRLAQPTLVAPRVVPVPGLSLTHPSSPIHSHQLGGGEVKRDITMVAVGRSAAIRQHLSNQGFSVEAINLWFNKTKGGERGATNVGHDKIWAKYSAWLTARGGRPYDFDIANITTYLTEVMIKENNNAAGRCKSFLSTCSVTRSVWLPNCAALADNSVIQGIRAGLDKTKSISLKKKPKAYFSIFKLFQHLATMIDDDYKCSIDQLRDKLIVLMMIDGMARASDIASVTREGIIIEDKSVTFDLYSTKESKALMEFQTSIGNYADNELICTRTVMKHYLDRTTNSETIIESINHTINNNSVKRTPLFIYQFKTNDTYKGLGSERISKIAKLTLEAIGEKEWKGHAVRGAASSKCVNLCHARRTEVCMRARWSSEATFMQSYHRFCNYKETNNIQFRELQLEYLLRFQATRVGC
jgi:hypothetical protein